MLFFLKQKNIDNKTQHQIAAKHKEMQAESN